MTVDKGWLNQGFFHKFFKEGVDNMADFGEVLLKRNFLFFSQSSSFFKTHILPEVNACNFLDGVNHVNPFKWFIDLDFSSLVVDRSISIYRDSCMLDNAFSQVHDVLEVCIGLVNLNGSELWIVSRIHSFVTEDTPNLIHSLHTADDKTFKVKLGCNPQYHVNVLGIVVGDKRTGSSTACLIMENRSFNFKEALSI